MTSSNLLKNEKKKGHVFVVDRHSFPVHSSKLFCGVKEPRKPGQISGKYSIFADLMGTRMGDLVFFYHMRLQGDRGNISGLRGIYKISSEPFTDITQVESGDSLVLGECPSCGTLHPEKKDKDGFYCSECGAKIPRFGHIVPNRVLIEPVIIYEDPVNDNQAYVDRTDKGDLWTLLFRKVWGPGRARSVCPILPEETEKISRLLNKINNGEELDKPSKSRYSGGKRAPINVNFNDLVTESDEVKYEHLVAYWFMKNIDKNVQVLKDVVGPLDELEWFGNEIIYGIGGDKVDVLTLHKRDGTRFRATIFELKKGTIKKADVDQVDRYSYWIAQLATANATPKVQSLELQPALLGHGIDQRASTKLSLMKTREITIPYPEGKCKVHVKTPTVMGYEVDEKNNGLEISLLA